MLFRDAVIERIEELKKKKGITQYMLSERSTVPQTTLISIKRKRSNAVSAKNIYLICEGFDITLSEFYDSPLFARKNLEME
jgi:transcriptional regulator with XRE-family HTH domain